MKASKGFLLVKLKVYYKHQEPTTGLLQVYYKHYKSQCSRRISEKNLEFTNESSKHILADVSPDWDFSSDAAEASLDVFNFFLGAAELNETII